MVNLWILKKLSETEMSDHNNKDQWLKDKWLAEARRWAKHAYCYEGMVDEFPEFFDDDTREAGIDPYNAVDQFAESNELDRADGFYGINSDKTFHKVWPTGNATGD